MDTLSQQAGQADRKHQIGGAANQPYRSGFVAIVGRPNVGKSTLVNTLVGTQIAIASSKPETTRKAIRAVLTCDNAQLVLVDTPGIHRPRTLLGQRRLIRHEARGWHVRLEGAINRHRDENRRTVARQADR